MILINKLQRPFVLTLMLLLAPVATVAHHAYTAEFDTTKPVKVSGVLTKVEWSNPHIWIYLDHHRRSEDFHAPVVADVPNEASPDLVVAGTGMRRKQPLPGRKLRFAKTPVIC